MSAPHWLPEAVLSNARVIRIYLLVLASGFLLASLVAALPGSHVQRAANGVAFLGILLLSVPTVRMNEQARQIYRARQLLARERGDPAPDAARLKRLEEVEQILAERKGSWTAPVQATLYLGYVLLFASALSRIL